MKKMVALSLLVAAFFVTTGCFSSSSSDKAKTDTEITEPKEVTTEDKVNSLMAYWETLESTKKADEADLRGIFLYSNGQWVFYSYTSLKSMTKADLLKLISELDSIKNEKVEDESSTSSIKFSDGLGNYIDEESYTKASDFEDTAKSEEFKEVFGTEDAEAVSFYDVEAKNVVKGTRDTIAVNTIKIVSTLKKDFTNLFMEGTADSFSMRKITLELRILNPEAEVESIKVVNSGTGNVENISIVPGTIKYRESRTVVNFWTDETDLSKIKVQIKMQGLEAFSDQSISL